MNIEMYGIMTRVIKVDHLTWSLNFQEEFTLTLFECDELVYIYQSICSEKQHS